MNRLLPLLALLVTATAGGSQADPVTRIPHTRSFPVEPGGSVVLHVADAHVIARPGASDRVDLQVQVTSEDPESALQTVEDMDFRFEQSDGEVRVHADAAPRRWPWRGPTHRVVVSVRLPADSHLEVETGDGDIQVESLTGHLHLHSGDGDIHIGNTTSPHVLLDSVDGDIVLGRIHAPDVQIETSDGRIEAEALHGRDIDIRTSDGDISIDALSGGLNVQSNDGDIVVSIDELEPTTLRTGDGNITVLTASRLNATVDFRGDDVVLRQADLDFDGDLTRRHVRGKLNGGGPRLQANSRDGRITLSTRR